MKTTLDTNILLDLQGATTLLNEQNAYRALRLLLEQGEVIASTVVYAEFSVGFRSRAELDNLLDQLGISVTGISSDAAFIAGQNYARYKLAGGPRQRILPDFLIAGHAMALGAQLLTRDRGFFRKYFQRLKVVEPASF